MKISTASAASLLLAALSNIDCADAGSVSPVPNGSSLVLSLPTAYHGYGIHYPQGLAAVQYLYGSEGTYKQYSGLIYEYGYYTGWTGDGCPNQYPTGTYGDNPPQSTLAAYANGQHATSTPDANDHVLFNLSYGNSTSSTTTHMSFEEHNGRGINGAVKGSPFSQFWFDDNWLARYMSEAYGAPLPDGLWAPTDCNRWDVLGGTTNWHTYDGSNIDQLALNGIYYANGGDYTDAYYIWEQILDDAATTYDNQNQRYTYPNINTEYQLGLFKILTDKLMDSNYDSNQELGDFIQHSVSLRSDILSDQQIENNQPIGWVTGGGTRTDPGSLINTETTAIDVLALGADARYSYEAGQSPMRSDCESTCFLRPYAAYSAVVGKSTANVYMVTGPDVTLPTGTYTVDFYIRSPQPTSSNVANIDIYDRGSNQVIATQLENVNNMAQGNQWTRASLPITVSNSNNSLNFRVYWFGNTNLDVAAVRIR